MKSGKGIDPIVELTKAETFLHLGRIQIIGCIAPTTSLAHCNPVSTAAPVDRVSYEKILPAIPAKPRTRIQARPLWAQYRSGRKMLDMCIEPMLIAGFSVFIRHGDEGATTQVSNDTIT